MSRQLLENDSSAVFDATTYSRVPNKRGGGENNRGGGGWKWFDITIIGEVGIIGGACWRNRK